MFLSKIWYFSVQKALIYYTVNKSHQNSFILLVFSHVANFRYVANFRFLTLSLSLSIYIYIYNPLAFCFDHILMLKLKSCLSLRMYSGFTFLPYNIKFDFLKRFGLADTKSLSSTLTAEAESQTETQTYIRYELKFSIIKVES